MHGRKEVRPRINCAADFGGVENVGHAKTSVISSRTSQTHLPASTGKRARSLASINCSQPKRRLLRTRSIASASPAPCETLTSYLSTKLAPGRKLCSKLCRAIRFKVRIRQTITFNRAQIFVRHVRARHAFVPSVASATGTPRTSYKSATDVIPHSRLKSCHSRSARFPPARCAPPSHASSRWILSFIHVNPVADAFGMATDSTDARI